MANSAVSWPSSTSRSRTSLATSASVRPTSGAGGDGLDDAVGRLGGLPHEGQLVGVLGAAQRCQQR